MYLIIKNVSLQSKTTFFLMLNFKLNVATKCQFGCKLQLSVFVLFWGEQIK